MRMKKTIMIGVILVFLSFNVSGSSFGSVAYQTNKKASLNTTFTLGLINLGDQSLEVSLSGSNMEKGELVLPDKKELPPSKISKNPGGSGWMSLDNGRYAKITEVTFWVISKGETGQESFNVQVEASTPREEADLNIEQRVVQTRNYEYQITFPENIGSLDREFEEGEERGTEIVQTANESKEQDQKDQAENETLYFNDSQKSNVNLSAEKISQNQSQINGMTYILGIGTFASILYLWWVI